MSEDLKTNRLQGRTVVYVPNRNRSKMQALNSHAETIGPKELEEKKAAVKAANKRRTADARKGNKKK